MKKLVSFAFVLGLMMFTIVSVKADSMQLKSVDTIIAEIRQEQSISSTDQIDISKVTSARLEELGDSVMEKVIGNTAVHDRMDIALGGDGSASLTAVHIRVGYDYLAGIPITMMTFMGAGGMMAYGGMMGGYGYYSNQIGTLPGYGGMMGGFGWVWMIVGLLGLIALVGVVVYLLTRNSKQQTISTDNNALNTLKQRYARGEITREEYSRMLEVLK
jgi:putative membrane protein